MTPQLVALVGPTAVGKTDVSIELARRLGAEIVGCDSMQVYRRMPRLTTQPTAEQRAAVRHHLMDCIEPTERFNVGEYRRLALPVLEEIARRGAPALIVGGTGMYLKALTDGFCPAPPGDQAAREQLRNLVEAQGSDALHARLRMVDPEAAAAIHPNDARRLMRALEVFQLTGQPLSRFWQGNERPLPITVIGLTRDRAELYDRINRRVVDMLSDAEVLDEVRQLAPLALSLSAAQVHGLRFLAPHLRGELTRDAVIPQWQQQVRNYAKRQLTWFRAQPGIRWLTLTAEDSVTGIVDRLRSESHGTHPLSHH